MIQFKIDVKLKLILNYWDEKRNQKSRVLKSSKTQQNEELKQHKMMNLVNNQKSNFDELSTDES